MKIPRSIKVGGRTYKIIFKRGLWRDSGEAGNCHYWTQEITIDAEAGDLGQTFLHEVLHSIDRHWNNHNLADDVIDALAEGLFQVLSDMGITFSKGE